MRVLSSSRIDVADLIKLSSARFELAAIPPLDVESIFKPIFHKVDDSRYDAWCDVLLKALEITKNVADDIWA
jgi:hypothetical protein